MTETETIDESYIADNEVGFRCWLTQYGWEVQDEENRECYFVDMSLAKAVAGCVRKHKQLRGVVK